MTNSLDTQRVHIEEILAQINHQIEVLENEASAMGIDLADMRTSDGSWVISEMLVAKSSALLALSNLEVARLI